MNFAFASPYGVGDRVAFDVGAYDGADGIAIAAQHPDWHVVAFEPNPRMHPHIAAGLAAAGGGTPLPNYTLFPYAVSEHSGEATLRLTANLSSSSLLPTAETAAEAWAAYGDPFATVGEVAVRVVTLGEVCALLGVTRINHLHVDAQGADLAVLRGLGWWRRCVVDGRLEVASSRAVAAYAGQDVLEDVLAAFREWRYAVIDIVPWADDFNEVDIRFRNRDVRPA